MATKVAYYMDMQGVVIKFYYDYLHKDPAIAKALRDAKDGKLYRFMANNWYFYETPLLSWGTAAPRGVEIPKEVLLAYMLEHS